MADLQIVPFALERAEDVVEIYNRGIVDLPYCAAIDVDYVVRSIVPRFFFHPEGLLIAYAGARPTGFVHATFAPSADRGDENPAVGSIAALFFPGAGPDVGQTLLSAAETFVARSGARRVLGWGSGATGYPFYRGLLGGLEPVLLEDHTDALRAFQTAGYAPYVESYLLASQLDTWPHDAAVEGAVETTFEPRTFAERWDSDSWRGLEPQIIRAFVDGHEVGALLFGLMPRLSAQRGEGIGSIAALRVSEDFRRRGIASLLTRRCLESLRSDGARQCLVACHRTNAAAIATYRKFGFRQAALMVGHQRTFREEEE